MASKLSEQEKQQVAELYCQPGSTTATLATQFGVSSSTISRVLRQQLSAEDYAEVTQWKRTGEKEPLELSASAPSGGQTEDAITDSIVEAADHETETAAAETSETATESSDDSDVETEPVAVVAALPEPGGAAADADEAVEPTETAEPPAAPQKSTPAAPVKRRSRRRSASADTEDSTAEQQTPLTAEPVEAQALSTADSDRLKDDLASDTDADDLDDSDVAAQWDADALEDDADDYDDDYTDEDDELDEEDEESDDWEEEGAIPEFHAPRREQLEILPLTDLTLQKPCYLVIDRLSELITCPLKEFAELGLIPEDEEQARTLPVFDNHRVARRFSRRNQRIIKVPNGIMLTKTQPYLSAKGITRLLFDGQVYALN
ncbi:MAG: transposase [Cyanobacteria bacterium P01_H01_bin.58]